MRKVKFVITANCTNGIVSNLFEIERFGSDVFYLINGRHCEQEQVKHCLSQCDGKWTAVHSFERGGMEMNRRKAA